MAYIFSNPNPDGLYVGDCVIRAVSIALNQEWEKTYVKICTYGFMMHDMPSSNHVWGKFLKDNGYRKEIPPSDCPDCYTVKDFCRENQRGTYLIATGQHLIAVIDGDYYDTFDSGDEVIMFYWRKE